MTSFIGRYWRGEYSLPISYWLVNIILIVVLLGVSIGIMYAAQSSASFEPVPIFFGFVLVFGLSVAASVWQYVGLYRSAWRYIEEKPKTKFWGYLALIMMCFGIVQTGLTLPASYLPHIAEFGDIVFRGDPKLPDYQLTIEAKGEEILIKGGIKYGLVHDLEEALEASPSVKTIELESVGGRFGVAFDLYKLIRKKGLNTVVNEYCLSACTLAFAGGKNRWLAPYAKIGFHRGKMVGLNQSELDTYVDGLWRQVADEQNLRLWAVKEHSDALHEDMSYPTRLSLLMDNFITSNTSGAQSSFEAYLSSNKKKLDDVRSQLPVDIDHDTALIDVDVGNLTNFYTYLVSDALVDYYNRQQNIVETIATLNAGICEEQSVADSVAEGIRYSYTYLIESNNAKWLSFELTCI